MESSFPKGANGGTPAFEDPRRTADDHAEKLREYACKVLVHGEPLTEEEEDDRADRMLEFRAIGNSFKQTDYEIVVELYGVIFTGKRPCGCPTCRQKRLS